MFVPSTITWRRPRTAVVALIVLAGIAACGSDNDSSPSNAADDPDTSTFAPDTSTGSTPSSPSTSPPGSSESSLTPAAGPATTIADDLGALGPTARRLVDLAITDLVDRFGLTDFSPDAPIVVAVADEVTWRDAALGCPAKGMQYAQVLTPGFRIVLQYDGATYAYHAGNGDPFYCARPETPVADGG